MQSVGVLTATFSSRHKRSHLKIQAEKVMIYKKWKNVSQIRLKLNQIKKYVMNQSAQA